MKKESNDSFARLERFKRRYIYEKEEEIKRGKEDQHAGWWW